MAGVLIGKSKRALPKPSLAEVQLRVQVVSIGNYRVALVFPNAGWSRSMHQFNAKFLDSSIGKTDAQQQNVLPGTQWPPSLDYSNPRYEVNSPGDKGQLARALGALYRTDQHGEAPSVKTYVHLLDACARAKSLVQAKQVHAHLLRYRLESTSELGEHVVCTFVKCGSLEDAVSVLHRLPHASALSWTALIAGYAKSGLGQEALRSYRRMQHKGVQPKPSTFVALLKACGCLASLEDGKWIHAEALKHRCESDLFVRTGLIDMYGKCGSVVDAQNLFFESSQRDVVSWNVMLAAYTQQGEAEKAFHLYNQMRKEGVKPNDRTFVSILQACGVLAEREEASQDELGKVKSLEKVKEIHADARAMGYDSDVYVGNTLISVYGKCGRIDTAWDVFLGLSRRNVVSWNAMLAALVQQHQSEKALELYKEMLETGFSPNDRTCVTILQACSTLAEKGEDATFHIESTKLVHWGTGRAIHGHARMKGYDVDVFVGNTLVTMYGRWGGLADAQRVFDRLAWPDVVSWNAILAAHVELGQADHAVQHYEQMLREGRSPNGLTFKCILQACGMLAQKEGDILVGGHAVKIRSMYKVKTIHEAAWWKGYCSDNLLANTLVKMYGKCGSVVDAQDMFDGLSQDDVVLWNVMLATHVEQVQPERALELYGVMREESVSPDARTFVSVIQACGILAEKEECCLVNGNLAKVHSLGKGKVLHSDTQKRSYNLDGFVTCTLISMYSKCKSIFDAELLFEELHQLDTVSWNAMLKAYVELDQGDTALQLFEKLRGSLSPDAWTFVSVLQACSTLAAKQGEPVDGDFSRTELLKTGKALHADICKMGYDSNVFVSSALVSMYGKCGSISNAESVFETLSSRSLVSWNSLLAAYAQGGNVDKAVDLYRRMQVEGVNPDDITLVCMLQVCSNQGNLDLCRQIHHRLLGCGTGMNSLSANALIAAYGRCASMVDAQVVFDAMLQPDEVSWNAMIAGHARQGNFAASFRCHEDMQLAGVKPNRVTFLSLLCMCSHSGLVDKGVHYFESMSKEYGITPTVEHYACMVDLFGRAGHFEPLHNLLSNMSVQPDIALWLCLLAACRKHGQIFWAEQAFKRAVGLQPKQAAAYILMSNIYADSGFWEHANKVKQLGMIQGARKKTSQTWIAHEHEVHNFVVRVDTPLGHDIPLHEFRTPESEV